MSTRSHFFSAIAMMKELARSPEFADTSIKATRGSNKARILRNGLTVSAFSTFETFAELRVNDAMQILQSSGIRYSNLPEQLRDFIVLEAIRGLNTQADFIKDKVERRRFIEKHALRIGGYLNKPTPSYTGLGFSPKGSNVGEADIKAVLKALGIDQGWNSISRVASCIGATIVSPADSFRNFYMARNAAAHDSLSNIPSSDLLGYLDTSLIIAITFDILLTFAVQCFVKSRTSSEAEKKLATIPNKFYFVQRAFDRKWEVHDSGLVIGRFNAKRDAILHASKRHPKFDIILRNSSLLPIELI